MNDLRTASLEEIAMHIITCGDPKQMTPIYNELRRRDELFTELVAKLRSLEWSSFDYENGNSCPCCYSESKHDADCGLAVLLAKADACCRPRSLSSP